MTKQQPKIKGCGMLCCREEIERRRDMINKAKLEVRKQTLSEVLKDVRLAQGNGYIYGGIEYPAHCGEELSKKEGRSKCILFELEKRLEHKIKELSKDE